MIGLAIVAGVILISLAYLAVLALMAAAEARVERTVVCPKTHADATVTAEPAHAVLSVLTGDAPRVGSCSEWPERAGCGRGCEDQLSVAATRR